jgi:hypothetical protein
MTRTGRLVALYVSAMGREAKDHYHALYCKAVSDEFMASLPEVDDLSTIGGPGDPQCPGYGLDCRCHKCWKTRGTALRRAMARL